MVEIPPFYIFIFMQEKVNYLCSEEKMLLLSVFNVKGFLPGALPGEGLPVFLCSKELKKFASTPSPLAAAPTLAPSIYETRIIIKLLYRAYNKRN